MYHIIINPVSGGDRAKRNLEKLEEILKQRNVAYEVHETQGVGDASRIAASLTTPADDSEPVSESVSEPDPSDGRTDIIVMGGDGSLHEVLNGIGDFTKCNLGLIPSGTGNDFAAAAGIPLDVEKAAEIILSGEVKPTNYLTVGDKRCMNVGGLGMDVDVLVRYNKGKKKSKGKYLRCLLQSILHFHGNEMEIVSEDGGYKKTHKAYIAAACNGSQIGGGIRICPGADVSDGKIEVAIVDTLPFLKLIATFMRLMRGKILKDKAMTHFYCERVQFRTKEPCTIQLDGELYDGVDFDAAIHGGLNFYRP